LKAWLYQIVNPMADHIAHRKSKQLPRAGTSIQAMAVVVRDQNRFGLAEKNCAEQNLQRNQATVRQPGGFLLRGCEVHYVSFAPSIQESRVVQETKRWALKPLENIGEPKLAVTSSIPSI
jgi:hypothetical protein